MAKLIYLWITFRLYRNLDLKIWCLFQGAGPLSTNFGRWLAGSILSNVDIFVARDPGSYRLIKSISPNVKSILAHDAIFLPGFENDLVLNKVDEKDFCSRIFPDDNRPTVGFNIRQWFHFVSSILPYQFSQMEYKNRSQGKMAQLIQASILLIKRLRSRENIRIVLISAYQPGVVPWEDDLPWLTAVKAAFNDDNEVILIDKPVSMPLYYSLMSRFDFVVGMRLHFSLMSLRFGVPTLNLSYTLKGEDILNNMGLPEYVVNLQAFIDDPGSLYDQVVPHLQNPILGREKISRAVNNAINQNMRILGSLMIG